MLSHGVISVHYYMFWQFMLIVWLSTYMTCMHTYSASSCIYASMILLQPHVWFHDCYVFTAKTFSFAWEMHVAQPGPMSSMFWGFYALVHTRIHSFLRHICMGCIIAVRLNMRSFFIPPFPGVELLFTPNALEEGPPSQAPLLHTCHLKERILHVYY